MKFLVLADCDDLFWRGAATLVDAIIGLGDLSGSLLVSAAQAHGTDTILAVKGNHDDAAPFPSPIRNGHLAVHTIDGLRCGGFGGAWRYKPRGHHLYEQFEAAQAVARIPAVDIFLAHNSPRHLHERDDHTHQGFDAFNTYLAAQRPRFFLHGHQHVNRESMLGDTRVIGVFGFRYLEIA